MKLNFLKKNYFFGRYSLVELTGSVPSVPTPKEIIMRIPTATSIVWVSVYIYVLIHYKFTVTESSQFLPCSFMMHYPPYLVPQRASATPAFLWHETNSFLCLYRIWPSTRRFSGCECSLPSPLKFVMECSATLAFLWHETNSFGVTLSVLCGLLHDVFQIVSVHTIPIEICYGMLRHACLFVTWN